ncbi:FAD-dependent monooxygenase [Rhizobacter sp. Root404]|uniref:FAD-dependent monooxygenase n=1 Tax=Rhizobacter sp. Root404 TaxID=1736528 RepID=UPI0006FAE23F|nr:FAD-dependent monooxygenase [Rhizobacter sp. Root404]KQW38878.1 2-octaprenyl-6-methoxyphenyl hydroxylase [Rhizobacter sp. Root404]
MPETPPVTALHIAVIGAGPVGLALALQAARALPDSQVTLFDARPVDKDVSGDPRTLALSLGSVQLLERLGAWRAELAQPILEVHVSQQPPSMLPLPGRLADLLGEPELRIRAVDEAVPLLGAVLSYGSIVAPLQQAWLAAEAAAPKRLHSRFGQPVAALKNLEHGVEVDAGIAERFDLAIVAEGGVFTTDPSRQLVRATERPSIRHDYRQTAWVGQVTFEDDATRAKGVAFERFTRHGPAALLPLKAGGAGLVWCVPTDDDPVRELDAAQRVTVLNSIFHPAAGRIASVTPLKDFALGLSAERTLTEGRTVRIGNAAQTLHPVAGQGLNLGLRDAFELVHALARNPDVDAVLRRLEWQRGPDRWAMIAATDFLARSFTWKLPGAGAARGLGLAALQLLGPAKSALARQMMFGRR